MKISTESILAQQAQRERAEQLALRQIEARIAAQFPELSGEVINKTVRGEYDKFADSRVRDFVPVLVERQVRAGFRDGGHSRSSRPGPNTR